jgi:hypothetical protein
MAGFGVLRSSDFSPMGRKGRREVKEYEDQLVDREIMGIAIEWADSSKYYYKIMEIGLFSG